MSTDYERKQQRKQAKENLEQEEESRKDIN